MRRGTTPTITFTIPFDAETIDDISVAFSQHGKIKIEKTFSDCTFYEDKISVQLSEEDTLSLSAEKCGAFEEEKVEIQLRVACGNDRLASNIVSVPVGRILRDGEL